MNPVTSLTHLLSIMAAIARQHTASMCFDKMVQLHMERDGMTQEEAEKFVNFNVISTLAGMERPPVILYPVEGYEKEEV